MRNIKSIIISSFIILIIITVTVCASYYVVTKYNIDKENNEAVQRLKEHGVLVESE